MTPTAKNIQRLRNRIKLSQVDFAKTIGYSRGYLADVEAGRVKPSRRFLEALDSRFGISIDRVLIGLGEKTLNLREYLSGHGFIYLFDFSNKNLDMAAEEVLEAFLDYSRAVIDVKDKSVTQMLSKITRKKGTERELWEAFRDTLHKGYKIFIFRNISSSKIDDKAHFLLNLYHEIRSFGFLIIIDESKLLADHYDLFFPSVYPIYIGTYTEEFVRVK